MLAVAEEAERPFTERLTFSAPAFEPARYHVGCVAPVLQGDTLHNWTFENLDDSRFKARLLAELPHEHTRAYLAPNVRPMSGLMLRPESFTVHYPLNRRCVIRRPGFKSHSDDKIPCDGTSISRQDGFTMVAGGCPLVVLSGRTLHGEELCLAAHAGRDCLIDRTYVHEGTRSRTHFSIVGALVAYAQALNAQPEDLVIRSFFALPWFAFPHRFDDPKFGQKNRELYAYLEMQGLAQGVFLERLDGAQCLSLSTLIARQAEGLGIGKIEVGECSLPENNAFAYTTHDDPRLGGASRNLVWLARY